MAPGTAKAARPLGDDMTIQLAKRMEIVRASDIREILKVTQRSEVISFAGGLPAPEFFPVKALIG